MRHVEIRDLWLERVRDGGVLVHKVSGIQNPADLITKVLTTGEIEDGSKGMNIRMEMRKGEDAQPARFFSVCGAGRHSQCVV